MKKNRVLLVALTVMLIAMSMNTILLLAEDNVLTMTIVDVEAKPGEDVEIPIIYTHVPENGLLNCDYELTYDPDVLEIKEIKAGEIVINPSGSFDSGIDKDNNVLILLYSEDTGDGTESIIEDGEFAIISATIKSDAPSGKSFIEFSKLGGFVGNDIKKIATPRTVNGTVEVIGGVKATPKDVSTDKPDTTSNGTPTPTSSETPSSTSDITATPTDTEQPTSTPTDSDNKHQAYLSGYPGNLFKPENNITRAEAAVIFAKLSGATPDTVSANNGVSFTDVSESHWSTWAVEYVTAEGLFSGYTDGTFMPDKVITRAEFATVVAKYLKKHGMVEEKTYNIDTIDDVAGHWAKENIELLVGEGYIKGYPDNTFRPNASIKRAESVALINRSLQRGPLYNAILQFVDVPKNHWAYKDIAEGVIDHSYKIDENGNEVMIEKLD